MSIGLWIIHIVSSLLFGILLELNHSRWIGWLLFIAVFALFPVAVRKTGSGILKFFFWLGCLAVYAGIFLFSWPRTEAVPASTAAHPDVTPVISIDKGDITGVFNEDHSVEIYAGIPYAAPPVGELRWKKPQEVSSWKGIRACDAFAPMSMQKTNIPIMDSLTSIIGYHEYQPFSEHSTAPVSEDSLYLNVWKPAGEAEKLPVIVYIHGGSLQTGQTWYQDYSGESFAKNGVIVVNMAYRLGVFGFLADETMLKEEGTTGNYGLLDQIKALEWVQKNISAFGGDPDNVTLVGESAGAVCVDALCVSPLAKGLFRRVVMESSTVSSKNPPHSYRSFDEALSSGRALLDRYACTSIDDLRKLDAGTITGEMYTQHHITVDGYVLPDTPHSLRAQGIHNEEALLHGFNAEESGPFILLDKANLKNYVTKIRTSFGEAADEVLALYPAETDEQADRNWAEVYGAQYFNYSHYCLNQLENENDVPVYEYLFTKKNGRLSCWHSGELIYAFGMIQKNARQFTESDYELSTIMHAYWINFAKTGDPNGEGLPEFPVNSDSKKIMELGDHVGMIEEPYLKLYAILERH